VRVGVRCDGEVPLATNSPIRAHGIPPRWRSEMRRWRRSCGDHSGLPPPTRSRNRRPQRVGSGPWNTTAVVQFVRQGRRNPRFESRLQATRRRTINRDEDTACSRWVTPPTPISGIDQTPSRATPIRTLPR
jgi:hypothetical protein